MWLFRGLDPNVGEGGREDRPWPHRHQGGSFQTRAKRPLRGRMRISQGWPGGEGLKWIFNGMGGKGVFKKIQTQKVFFCFVSQFEKMRHEACVEMGSKTHLRSLDLWFWPLEALVLILVPIPCWPPIAQTCYTFPLLTESIAQDRVWQKSILETMRCRVNVRIRSTLLHLFLAKGEFHRVKETMVFKQFSTLLNYQIWLSDFSGGKGGTCFGHCCPGQRRCHQDGRTDWCCHCGPRMGSGIALVRIPSHPPQERCQNSEYIWIRSCVSLYVEACMLKLGTIPKLVEANCKTQEANCEYLLHEYEKIHTADY